MLIKYYVNMIKIDLMKILACQGNYDIFVFSIRTKFYLLSLGPTSPRVYQLRGIDSITTSFSYSL